MAVKTSYSRARQHLASLWDEVESSREPALIHRRGHEDMALIPAGELASLREAVLRDPFEGIGKPERLKQLGGNVRFRRINEADRLVYEVFEDGVEFLQARYHY